MRTFYFGSFEATRAGLPNCCLRRRDRSRDQHDSVDRATNMIPFAAALIKWFARRVDKDYDRGRDWCGVWGKGRHTGALLWFRHTFPLLDIQHTSIKWFAPTDCCKVNARNPKSCTWAELGVELVNEFVIVKFGPELWLTNFDPNFIIDVFSRNQLFWLVINLC